MQCLFPVFFWFVVIPTLQILQEHRIGMARQVFYASLHCYNFTAAMSDTAFTSELLIVHVDTMSGL